MNSFVISLLAFAFTFGSALLGMAIRARLPEEHLNEESRRVVHLGAGIIGTMAALVLGLLVASAKSNYDRQRNELTTVAAKVILLHRALAIYGPEAQDFRDLLRRFVAGSI